MGLAETKERIVILGVGNLLLMDEGVGVHAAVNLRRFPLPGNVEVIEGGTDGFKLFHVVSEADRLIVVDCVKGGGEPASIYRFDVQDLKHMPDRYMTSVHQVSILEVINLSGLVGKSPKATIIGVEPSEIRMSMDLSPLVREKLPRVLELALETAGLDPGVYRSLLDGHLVKPGPCHADVLIQP